MCVRETAAEPEGQFWFSWHLYDLGATGPSLTSNHRNTQTHTHTPAVPLYLSSHPSILLPFLCQRSSAALLTPHLSYHSYLFIRVRLPFHLLRIPFIPSSFLELTSFWVINTPAPNVIIFKRWCEDMKWIKPPERPGSFLWFSRLVNDSDIFRNQINWNRASN